MARFAYLIVYVQRSGEATCESLTKEAYDKIYNKYASYMSLMPIRAPESMGYTFTIAGDWCDRILIKRRITQ